jgi:hypothetical protein
MATHDDILRAIGLIEGKLSLCENLSLRVSSLERSLSWLKGGWAALVGMLAWLFHVSYGRW